VSGEYLRRDVVGRAAEGASRVPALYVLLAHSEIGDLDVAAGVEHHVVQLQVAAKTTMRA